MSRNPAVIEAALASRHAKAAIIGPVLAQAGVRVIETEDFDTDSLGTFSGEVERTMAPAACALFKARKACDITGLEYGLGSEGSFGGGPMPGLVSWGEEILCFHRRDPEQVIYGRAGGPFALAAVSVTGPDELLVRLAAHPGQHWIARPGGVLRKGLAAAEVESLARSGALGWPLSLEPDLRAMCSPLRRQRIRQAAEDLVVRLDSRCPRCDATDFVPDRVETGLPCSACGTPTGRVSRRVARCRACGHEETQSAIPEAADPYYCPCCNP